MTFKAWNNFSTDLIEKGKDKHDDKVSSESESESEEEEENEEGLD